MRMITGADLAIPIVGGLTFVFLYLDIPLWALFFGWAWYFILGAKPSAIVAGTPPAICGGIIGILGVNMIEWLTPMMTANVAIGVALLVTLFIVMMLAKIPALKETIPFFNAYASYFVGVAATGTYGVIEGLHPQVNALIYVNGANVLGLFVGYLTVAAQEAFDRMLAGDSDTAA